MHGDAAFAGQGVVAETLAMSQIKGYRVGGTIHVIVNNQLGFTTPPESARSSEYCTDIAKSVQAPIFHVNGDDPEACVRVARLAYAYRQRFHKDVVIDMVCYRRQGHNEGDDPSYTQPIMYRTIEKLRSVRKIYVENLVRRGDITLDEAESALADFQSRLQTAFDQTRSSAPEGEVVAAPHPPNRGVLPHVSDRCRPSRVLTTMHTTLDEMPEGFMLHPKLAEAVRDPLPRCSMEDEVDWALAEEFAIGSLLIGGHLGPSRRAGLTAWHVLTPTLHAVRLRVRVRARPAQEARRGRPAPSCGSTTRCSPSTRRSVSSTATRSANPDALVMWEAQFGDFANGAQIIIDQFIVAAEDKWGQTLRSGDAAAPRLRGPGTRAFLGTSGAVPDALPPRTTSRCASRPLRLSTSTCCAARSAAVSASR